MTWSYASPTGDALNGPPPFMRLIRIQVFDPCGVVLQDSLGLEPTTMSRTLNPPVSMSRIAEIRFQLVDGQGDLVTVHYGGATPGNCRMFEFTAPSYSAPENVSPAHVTVSRVGDLTAGPLTVDFHTSDGTAHAPVDYLDASHRLTFNPGVTTQAVSVPIVNGPTLHDAPTSVLMSLQNPSAGTSVGALGTAILDINDQGPRVRFSAGSYNVSEASATATITVQRTGAATPVVSVNYATSDGTAVAPDDYEATAGVLTFLAGQTSKTFTVPIGNDLRAEGNQTVNLTLTNPIGALLGAPATAVLTITDNDTGGTVTFSAATYSVAADDLVTIGVTRTGGTGGGVTVHYATSDPGGRAGATVGADYDAASGHLTFGRNETTKTFTVQTHGVTVNKAVTLTLYNLSPGASLRNPNTATLWIIAVPSGD